jgi:hypothetical protein
MTRNNRRIDTKENCKRCGNWEAIREHVRVSELLDEAIKSYDEKLKEINFKPSVAEYLKLLQLERELDEELVDMKVEAEWTGLSQELFEEQ